MKYSLILLFFFFTLTAKSQNDYVITLQGDTIKGKASIIFSNPVFDQVSIKNDEIKEDYLAYQLKQLNFNGQSLDVVKLSKGYKFGVPQYKGDRISRYYIQEESNYDFDAEIVVKSNGEFLPVSNIGFKKRLADFLKDCDELRNQIEEGELRKASTDSILMIYNNCFGYSITGTEDGLRDPNADKIKSLLMTNYQTLVTWDFEEHSKYITENYLLVEDGQIWTWEDEKSYYQENAGRKITRKDTFEFKQIDSAEEVAVAVYKLTSDFTENGVTSRKIWLESAVLRKVEGNWKIHLIHSTEIRRR